MNQQIYPQSIYPVTGDAASSPGNPGVKVVGIQNIPVSSQAPTDQQSLVFQASLFEYVPSAVPFNQSICVEGVAVSDDYDFSVENVDVSINQVESSFPPNGSPIYIEGSPV